MRRAMGIALSGLLAACSSSPRIDVVGDDAGLPDGGAGDDYLIESAVLFDPGKRLDVDLEVATDEWRQLGLEGRGLSAAACDREGLPPESLTYTWWQASVTVDGESVSDVAVRKKGFLGSLSVTRPSVKVSFDTFSPGREFHGMEKLTLNNNRQDASMIRQCVAYWLFDRAGVPAPRCELARVRVNGDDLGTYSHVEGITKRFLRSRFGNDTGNLYEGQGADFLSENWGAFELKTNEAVNDRSNLDRMKAALLLEGSSSVTAIEELLDLDAFFTYWAMEALVAHWDSYSTTRNNFLLYDDAAKGFQFIPWGTDASLTEAALTGGTRPQSISADSDLSRHLFEMPDMRERYVGRMRQLLDRVWDEPAILARIDQLATLLPDGDATDIESIREFVRRRREVVTAELDVGPAPQAASQICFLTGVPISGSFSGTWGGDPASPGTLQITIDGQALALTSPSVTGAAVQVTGPAGRGVMISAVQGDGSPLTLQLQIEERVYGATTIPFHGLSNLGLLVGPPAPASPFPFQFVTDGTLTLTEAGTAPGEPVAGSFEGRTYALTQ